MILNKTENMFCIKIQDSLFVFKHEADAVEQLTLWFKDKIQVLDKGSINILNLEEDDTWRTSYALQNKNRIGYFKTYSYDTLFDRIKEQNTFKSYLKEIIYPELRKFAEKPYQSILQIKNEQSQLENFLSFRHENFSFYQTLFEFEIFEEKCYFEQSIVETLKLIEKDSKKKDIQNNESKKSI